jgi:diketogulonate reductase-like aldo/keto reductase
MLCKELGDNIVQIPEIGIGTWNYRGGSEPLRQGLDAGALFIDTAESYGTESVVAKAIEGRRDQIFLATKVSPAHFRADDILKAVDNSLRRLRTDHIDLYQLHEPNESVPLAETVGAMIKLVEAGKVRFMGVSNFSVRQLQEAQLVAGKHPIVSNQVRFNLVDRTICRELLPYCQAHHVTVIAYSPLARGLDHILDCDPQGVLIKMGNATGRTVPQIALNWCLCQQGVVAIPKGNSIEHVRENCGASDWRLTASQLRQLDETIRHRRRTGLEQLLRRCLPRGLKRVVQEAVRFAPRSLRRRIS